MDPSLIEVVKGMYWTSNGFKEFLGLQSTTSRSFSCKQSYSPNLLKFCDMLDTNTVLPDASGIE
jgi:hypothetical protein